MTRRVARSVLDQVERSLIRLRRHMGRRTLGRYVIEQLPDGVDLAILGVVDAIDEGRPPDGALGIAEVSQRLAVDPSRASRTVKAAIAAGYVRRTASQSDGRRVELELTDAGRDVVDTMHRVRQAHLAQRMQRWSTVDQREFARLLALFVDDD